MTESPCIGCEHYNDGYGIPEYCMPGGVMCDKLEKLLPDKKSTREVLTKKVPIITKDYNAVLHENMRQAEYNESMTRKQLAMLHLRAKGFSNKEIADITGDSAGAIQKQIYRLKNRGE
jgi:DNA-binding NarL/FixJ family response regulator